jgi:hypothetical protein
VLTVDLVHVRRRGTELHLVRLDAKGRERAVSMAGQILSIVAANVGSSREDVEAALKGVEAAVRDQKLKDGLIKLALDACDFDEGSEVDAVSLRRDVFTRAAAARREGTFDREAILGDIDERDLYADLRGAHVLRGMKPTTPALLVDLYDRSQAQAVLLRAVKVAVEIRASAAATRAFFRRLKFLRLLHTIEGNRVFIDGPFSLFEASTKYGLQLAMLLPALDGCDSWTLVAEVRWGKERTPLTFKLEGGGGKGDEPALPDEVAALLASFKDPEWKVAPSRAVLDLPGVGLCIPDLVFEKDGTKVYLEVMGYWSRDAVWKRVELVEKGLDALIVFAVSQRLRVSEEVLDTDHAALYVYKGVMSARAILERVSRLQAARRSGRPNSAVAPASPTSTTRSQ